MSEEIDADKSIPDDAIWYRHMLTPTEVVQGPEGSILNPKFWENRFILTRRENVTWKRELSGRLLSKAGSVKAAAESSLKRVRTEEKAFHGVIMSNGKEIREIDVAGTFDAIYTPTKTDDAHTDLVSYDDLLDEFGELSTAKTKGLRDYFYLITHGAPKFPNT